MPTYKLMIARFPYLGSEATECVDWLMDLMPRLMHDRRLDVFKWKEADTPITMTRNNAIDQAQRAGMDFLLMVDSDMAPDLYVGVEPGAKPFFPTSFEFLLAQPKPSVVAAPYCGPPPLENVYVFEWKNEETGNPNRDLALGQVTREDAARRTGIEEVGALPTGLILFDMRAFAALTPPYTSYEFVGDGDPCPHCGVRTPGVQAKKASTEDVVITRDLALAGVPQFCNWDAWAGHVKRKVVGKPLPWDTSYVSEKLRRAVARGQDNREKLVTWPPAGAAPAKKEDPVRRVAVPTPDLLPAPGPFPESVFWTPGLQPLAQDLPTVPAEVPAYNGAAE